MPAHYDFAFFIAAGVSAMVFETLWHMLAAWVATKWETLGKAMGALS